MNSSTTNIQKVFFICRFLVSFNKSRGNKFNLDKKICQDIVTSKRYIAMKKVANT